MGVIITTMKFDNQVAITAMATPLFRVRLLLDQAAGIERGLLQGIDFGGIHPRNSMNA